MNKITMDFFTFLLVFSLPLFSCFYVLISNSRRRKDSFRLPPGPRALPIIGNIHQLGPNPHQSLAKLSKEYGPIIYLKLGSRNTIVVSSPEIAKQVLQKYDQVLSGRPSPIVVRVKDHHKASVVWLPARERWRHLRKICKEHMFSHQTLSSGEEQRQEKIQKLCDYVQECSDSGRVVDISDAAFTTLIDLMSASLFSTDFDSDSSQELQRLVHDLFDITGTPNLSDHFSVLKHIDLQGLARRTAITVGKMYAKFDDIIEKRLESESGKSRDDLLEVLLEIRQRKGSEFTRNDIIHLLIDLFAAGTDTTAATVEWAMAELINNPKKISKLKDELKTLFGENERIKESDIPKLSYLQAVVKETLRLHPVNPLLIPHKAEDSVEISGYRIPKDAEILVNIWSICREPSIWINPEKFEPERFLDCKIDLKGQDFEFIPFGSGRRICPGLPLACRIVNLIVASLIHNFDWKLEGEMNPEEMDMAEKFELSLQKAVPLKVIPMRSI